MGVKWHMLSPLHGTAAVQNNPKFMFHNSVQSPVPIQWVSILVSYYV